MIKTEQDSVNRFIRQVIISNKLRKRVITVLAFDYEARPYKGQKIDGTIF